MKKLIVLAAFTSVLFGAVTLAAAGAYGEAEQPIEVPATPPAPPAPPAPVTPPAEPDYARTGFYLQGGIAYGFDDFDDDGAGDFDVEESPGFDVRAGYRASEHLAVEVQFQRFADFEVGDEDLEFWAATVNGKFFFATGSFQPYVLAGVGFAEADFTDLGESEGAFTGRLAVGADTYITENCGIAGELGYILPSGDLDDLNVMPINLNAFWRF